MMTYAVYIKSFAKEKLGNELIDPDEQVRVELWEYDPKQFSVDKMADRLSVALSFAENEDERIEEAIEEFLEGVWRKQVSNKTKNEQVVGRNIFRRA